MSAILVMAIQVAIPRIIILGISLGHGAKSIPKQAVFSIAVVAKRLSRYEYLAIQPEKVESHHQQ